MEPNVPRPDYPRQRKRPVYKSDTSKLRYISGKQKWFAKAYRNTDPNDPYRQMGRQLMGNTYRGANTAQKVVRNALQYYGPGDYRNVVKWIPRGIGAAVGGALGWQGAGVGGISGGMKSGWDTGAGWSKWMGWGDYAPNGSGHGHTSVNQIMGGGPPLSVNSTGDYSGDIIMQRTEFVSNISCSTGVGQTVTPYQSTAFEINPGLSSTFPWLSQIASNFELYDWEGLMFMYRPTSGEFGASAVSNALGKVVMATKYGVTQFIPFQSTVEAQNYDYANSTKPSLSMVHGVETKNSSQVGGDMLVIRDDIVPNTSNIVLYDLGRLFVMTEGIPLAASNTAIIGELWVTYKIRLSRAKLWNALSENFSYSRGQWRRNLTQFIIPISWQKRDSGAFTLSRTNISASVGDFTVTNSSPTFLNTTFMVLIYGYDETVIPQAICFDSNPAVTNCTRVDNGITLAGPNNAWNGPDVGVGSSVRGHHITWFLKVTNPNLPFTFRVSTNQVGFPDAAAYQILVVSIDNNVVDSIV
ncbi:capsid protein [Crucivirus-298]|nr:capsid protein [Crucivirus-298]